MRRKEGTRTVWTRLVQRKSGEAYKLFWYAYGPKRRQRTLTLEDFDLAKEFEKKIQTWLDEKLDIDDQLELEGYKIVWGKLRSLSQEEIIEGRDKEKAKVKGISTGPIYIDKKVGELDWRRILKHCKEGRKIANKADWTQDTCKVHIPIDKPIAVALTADWHFGSLGVDYDSWEKDIKFFLDTDRLYEIAVGDLINNFIRFPTVQPILDQVIQPQHQKLFLEAVFLELVNLGKIIACAAGNHDIEFDKRIIGTSQIQEYISRLVPFSKGKGFVQLTVGDERYTILLMHKERFHSYRNALHGTKREYEITYPADIVVTAHTHVPAFEMYHHYDLPRSLGMGFGGETYLVKTGTYLVDDEYSKRFWGAGIIGTPTVVLFPDHHEMVMFSNAERAVQFMNAVT